MVAAPTITTLDLDAKLKARGIYEVATEAGWQAYTYNGMWGWRYPLMNGKGHVYTVDGKPAYRWKNFDSHSDKFKYSWLPGKPDGIRYYSIPGTGDVISEKQTVYIASGEPDLLTYRAAGYQNVLCWFGENSIPKTFVTDMQDKGVFQVRIAPDLDAAGMKMVSTLAEMLSLSDISLHVIPLPGEAGSKMDVNALWQQLDFNAARFQEYIDTTEALDDAWLDYKRPINHERPTHYAGLSAVNAGELPPRFIEAITRYVESLDGFKGWKGNGWCKNVKCPLHDDHNASAGFNRETMSFNCFVCGDMSAKDFGAAVNIHLRDCYDTPLPRMERAQSALTLLRKPAPTEAALWADSDEVADNLIAQLRGESVSTLEPMPFPFESLHHMGGFAEMMWPGKMTYISGPSGTGKTSVGEAMYFPMLENGIDGIWYGPEWSPEEMGLRYLQREGGMNQTAFSRYLLYLQEKAAGKPQKYGIPKDAATLNDNIAKLAMLKAYPGKMSYCKPDKQIDSMNALIDAFELRIETQRAKGRNPRVLFFDYLQRAPKMGGVKGWDNAEMVVNEIKSLCERQRLFGFVFIQPTKSASRATRDGKDLNESSGQGISDQQANLYLTLTPGFDVLGKRMPYIKVNVVKNSMGMTGDVLLHTRMERLLVLDKVAKLDKKAFSDMKFEGELTE